MYWSPGKVMVENWLVNKAHRPQPAAQNSDCSSLLSLKRHCCYMCIHHYVYLIFSVSFTSLILISAENFKIKYFSMALVYNLLIEFRQIMVCSCWTPSLTYSVSSWLRKEVFKAFNIFIFLCVCLMMQCALHLCIWHLLIKENTDIWL